MDYFKLYPHRLDECAMAAWDAEIKAISQDTQFSQFLERCGRELLPSVIPAYKAIRALPRSARRNVQRQLARSQEISTLLREQIHDVSAAKLQRQLASSLAGAALLLALGRGVGDAATITVTTNIPTIVTDGKCSLAEAIINANDDAATHTDCAAGSGADTIVLPASSTHSLPASVAIYGLGYVGLPSITSTITIEGNGGRISRPKNLTRYRLFAVTNTGDLTLNNVTLSGGRDYYGGAIINGGKLTITGATISGAAARWGGAVYNGPGRHLAISGSTLTKNEAYFGGLIFNKIGSVTIENSTISSNKSSAGGAIYSTGSLFSFSFGSIQIENSTISGNKAIAGVNQPNNWGGGIFAYASYVTISHSTISKNSASYGAGIMTQVSVTEIENSLISSNKATVFGGGVSGTTTFLTIDGSEISKNSAPVGGGIAFLASAPGSLEISNSTISQNRAAYGGGINNGAPAGTIDNSTISGNKASVSGGGLTHSSGSLEVTNSTITGNSAKQGGGIQNYSNQLSVGRTIVAGNKATTGPEIENLTANGATVVADDFNLFGVSGNSGLVDVTVGTTDIVPSVALGSILDKLAENGGPTPTHALVTGSPAIDAVPGADPGCTGDDQRGVARPQGAGCDIGAFEK